MSDPATSSTDRAEGQLRRLVEANQRLVAELSLAALPQQIVTTAASLVGAGHAVLGIAGADGTLEEVTEARAGRSDAVSQDPGRADAGRAAAAREDAELLRTLLEAARPVHHLRAGGAGDLLSVPVRSGQDVRAVLYVADRPDGTGFSAEDEDLLTGYGATAGVALANGRLYAETRRRQQWLEASAQVGHQLLSSDSDAVVLAQIADSVAALAAADTVQIVLPVPGLDDTLEFAVSRGPGAAHASGLRYPASGSIAAEAMQSPDGLVLNGARARLQRYPDERARLPITDLLALPLRGHGRARGCVVVCRSTGRPFSAEDVEMARSFTSQAALALELADARTNRSRLGLMEERSRIARDLHDHVLQKLFGAGLSLQGAATMTADPAVRERLSSTVATLDDAIGSIRASVFEV